MVFFSLFFFKMWIFLNLKFCINKQNFNCCVFLRIINLSLCKPNGHLKLSKYLMSLSHRLNDILTCLSNV